MTGEPLPSEDLVNDAQPFGPPGLEQGPGEPWVSDGNWGPGDMLNDMGPSRVTMVPDDLESAMLVRNAVERALGTGEEYEYDE